MLLLHNQRYHINNTHASISSEYSISTGPGHNLLLLIGTEQHLAQETNFYSSDCQCRTCRRICYWVNFYLILKLLYIYKHTYVCMYTYIHMCNSDDAGIRQVVI